MNFKHMETFIAVVEWMSFSEAAKKLYLTQPTISTHISQLEAELNIRLIQRTTKKLSITRDGLEFYKYAKSISRIVDSIEESFSLKANKSVTMGCSSVPSNFILPKILSIPEIKDEISELNILVGDSESTIEGVLNGAMNIGIVGFMSPSKDLKYEKIMTDSLVIVTPNNEHFRALKESGAPTTELLSEPLILRESGSGTRKEAFSMLEGIGKDKNSLNIKASVNDSETIKKLISEGFGISIMSGISVDEEVKRGELLSFEIKEVDAVRNFYFIYRANYTRPETIKEIVRLTKKSFGRGRTQKVTVE